MQNTVNTVGTAITLMMHRGKKTGLVVTSAGGGTTMIALALARYQMKMKSGNVRSARKRNYPTVPPSIHYTRSYQHYYKCIHFLFSAHQHATLAAA